MISSLLGLIGCQRFWYQFLNISVGIAPDRFVKDYSLGIGDGKVVACLYRPD